jgi:hypothetical protein
VPRTHRPLDGAAVTARATLSDDDAARFDRLAGAVSASPGGVLGPALRAVLPGTSGVRWLHGEGLPSTARVRDLTAEQWLALFASWSASAPARGDGHAGPAGGGRPTGGHGHAPGAQAAPRWF